MQVGYPEFSKPLDNNNNPNLRIKAEGFHYEIGKRDPNRPEELGKWTAKNSGDLVNFSFLRIKEPLPNWGIDDVLVKTTLIFDGGDPRVDFENGQTVFETEEKTNRHNITFNRMSQGYFSMKFIFRPLKTKAIVYTMNCTMGDRKDSFVIDESSVDNVVWEFYSNKKYMEETSFTYEIEAVAFGPDPTDDEIKFRSPSPIKVNVSSGPIKIGKAQISYPDEPPEHTQKIKEYIKAFQAVT
jgi:hypothetical protein